MIIIHKNGSRAKEDVHAPVSNPTVAPVQQHVLWGMKTPHD